MPRLSITDVAARVGVHKSTVSRQARAHGLVGEDGKVDLADYQRLRDTRLDPALQTTGSAPSLPSFDADRPEIAAERALKLAADRERAQLELAARKGELVSTAEVASAEEDTWRTVRDKFMGAPRAWADHLLDVSEPAVMEARLRRLFNATLRDIADTLERDDDAAGRSDQRSPPGAPGGSARAEATA